MVDGGTPDEKAAVGRSNSERNRSASLRRALVVLEAVASAAADGTSGLNLSQLAERAQLNRSTVLRLLQPLLETRLIDLDATTNRYRLGAYTAFLGQAYLEQLDIRAVAEPLLRDLVMASSETAHLGVLDDAEVVYVHKIESPLPVRMVSRIGSRQPLHCTAMGKLFLAHGASDLFERVVQRGLVGRTVTTITTATALEGVVARARIDGYAVDDAENEAEIRCVAAPVFDHDRRMVAAVSLSGPTTRMSVERLRELSSSVIACSAAISRQLGAPERGALSAQ